MLTAEQKRSINDALTRHNGDRTAAAETLGMDPRKLKDTIRNNKDLSRAWTVKESALMQSTATELKNGPDLPQETFPSSARPGRTRNTRS